MFRIVSIPGGMLSSGETNRGAVGGNGRNLFCFPAFLEGRGSHIPAKAARAMMGFAGLRFSQSFGFDVGVMVSSNSSLISVVSRVRSENVLGARCPSGEFQSSFPLVRKPWRIR